MRPESLEECYPVDRTTFKSQVDQGNVIKAWMVACNERDFAVGMELARGVQCVLATRKGSLVTFRQFEGAHKELFDLGIDKFRVNAEQWDDEAAYNRWKAQYEIKLKRDHSIFYC